MIELNLLPDVKLEYIKTQRARRLTLTVAMLVTAASIALLILLLGFDGLQKKHLNDLNHDINTETSQLQGKPNINQILTVQNQLNSLTALHAGKFAASRVFDYLNALTPASVSINDFTIDFTQQTINITGAADALSSVNQFVDTLKCTTYTTGASGNSSTSSSGNSQPCATTPGSSNSGGGTPAFSNVVLSSFGLNSTSPDQSQAANYTITLGYDKTIFDITQNINLTVHSLVATRPGQQQPSDLFKGPPATTTTPSGGSQ